ncbi:MAG: GNAT family N-acetyltransferase [Pseudomonadota bacterium]
MDVRPAQPDDLDALLTINEAAVPGVNSLTAAELRQLFDMALTTLVAHQGGKPAGFVLCLSEGLNYASLNYAWISERYPQFAYIDRVAVASTARGTGLGRALYTAAFAHLGKQRETVLCEVNLEPPNPGSIKFHAALGFNEMGQRWLPDRSKGVVYLARDI